MTHNAIHRIQIFLYLCVTHICMFNNNFGCWLKNLNSQKFIYFPNKIFLPAPIFDPACVAPLFWPACKPIIVCPAANCSSVNSRLHSSAGFGPRFGPVKDSSFHVCLKKKNFFVKT